MGPVLVDRATESTESVPKGRRRCVILLVQSIELGTL